MSGVSRLKAAKKGGGSNPLEHAHQKQGRNGSASDCAEALTVPKKKGAWERFPNTGVPIGNESPHRGEHPQR